MTTSKISVFKIPLRSLALTLLFVLAKDTVVFAQDAPGTSDEHATASHIIAPFFHPPAEFENQYGEFADPMVFEDGTRVKTPDDWKRRRLELLTRWRKDLGDWPPLITEPETRVISTVKRENYSQQKIRFRWTPNQWTEAYLLVPESKGKHPAVVTVYYEPETAAGIGDSTTTRPHRDFARQLARRGFVALSIGTREATQNKTYALYHPSIDNATVQPLSMLAYAAANAWHVLASRSDVDENKIGIVGHSFGGKWAMFASCLFERYACAVWSDPGILFQNDRPSINYWEPWYLGYHPPPWRNRGLISASNPAHGLYPRLISEGRNLHELHVLMAPRPFLVSGGSEDPPERWIALNHSRKVNRLLGDDAKVAMTNRKDHAPNKESNQLIYAFFEHVLMDK